MPYFGCRTVCNKACWGLFGVAVAVGLVLLSSGAGTYATCHSKHRNAPAACYQAAAAVMVAGAVVLVLSASCPLYMSSCCAQPPAFESKALESKDLAQSSVTVIKPGRHGKASVYHYNSEGQLSRSPGVTSCTPQHTSLERPPGGNISPSLQPGGYLYAPAFHHHTIDIQSQRQ